MIIQRLEDKCTQCMLCVSDCVSGVFQENQGEPEVKEPDWCNKCSHCLAVCPAKAVVHNGLDSGQVRRVDKKKLSAETFLEVVRTRRSVRRFKDKPVDKETIVDILDMARFSPTSSNDQNIEYIVVRDQDLIAKVAGKIFNTGQKAARMVKTPGAKKLLAGLEKLNPDVAVTKYVDTMGYYERESKKGRDFILHNAPVLILAHAPKKAPFGCDNCNIAVTNITNYAHTLGLGTCYIGFLTLALGYSRGLRKLLHVPPGRKVYASIVMGWPAYGHKNTTSRKPAPVQWVG